MTTSRDDRPGDERLLEELARRNWIILGVLVLASLPLGSIPFSAGVLAGGLLVIAGNVWLKRSLRRLLEEASGHSARRFKIGFLLRLLCLGAALYLLIGVARVHPVGLAIGLSVVVINLIWTTVKRAF